MALFSHPGPRLVKYGRCSFERINTQVTDLNSKAEKRTLLPSRFEPRVAVYIWTVQVLIFTEKILALAGI